jgi:hypothetical protein
MNQRVAMRLVAQRWDQTEGTWELAVRSDWFTRTATPDNAAMFRARSVAIPDAFESNDTHRVKVQLRWFGRDGVTPVGKATIWPHWYLAREGTSTHEQDDWCGGTTG